MDDVKEGGNEVIDEGYQELAEDGHEKNRASRRDDQQIISPASYVPNFS